MSEVSINPKLMANEATGVTYYAILIGINAYQEKPLKGSVRDIQKIKSYLEGASIPIQIRTFTAANKVDAGSSSAAENPGCWPSYHNVTSAFADVSSNANSGDFVYIHFSGHGTRLGSLDEFSNKSTGDLALVLLEEEGKTTGRYLKGSRLARSLQIMVNKGLIVSLVLDCCFSASVYREDPGVRFLPYDSEIDSECPSDHPNSEEDLKHSVHRASRDASMLSNWLIYPERYTILTACGPHERASELTSKDGETHGALSYFLLSTLAEWGLRKRHKDIYNHLRAMFKKSWPQQNPVFYGNKDQGFLGHVDPKINMATIPVIDHDGSLHLQAGQAHGVIDGDEFVLKPIYSTTGMQTSPEDSVSARAARVGPLTSELQPVSEMAGPAQTWMAKPLTRCSLRNFRIRLEPNVPQVDKIRSALKEKLLDVDVNANEFRCLFQVVMRDMEYKILDNHRQEVSNVPIMLQSETETSHLCDAVEHLAKFEFVRELGKSALRDSIPGSFSASIVGASGESFAPDSLVDIDHGKTGTSMRIRNEGNSDLYVHVYDMGPCWDIQNMIKGTYEVIPPFDQDRGFSGTFEKKITMTVPSTMRRNKIFQCKDIIKVFVTSHPTSFDFLELPKLGEPKINGLDKDRISRACQGKEPNSSESWTALNFQIRTTVRQTDIK